MADAQLATTVVFLMHWVSRLPMCRPLHNVIPAIRKPTQAIIRLFLEEVTPTHRRRGLVPLVITAPWQKANHPCISLPRTSAASATPRRTLPTTQPSSGRLTPIRILPECVLHATTARKPQA